MDLMKQITLSFILICLCASSAGAQEQVDVEELPDIDNMIEPSAEPKKKKKPTTLDELKWADVADYITRDPIPVKPDVKEDKFVDYWIGRSAGRPYSLPTNVAEAKETVMDLFENEYKPVKTSLASRYYRNATIQREMMTPRGRVVTWNIPQTELRGAIREWVKEEQSRDDGEVEYSLASYKWKDEEVTVTTLRVERNPYAVISLTVVYGRPLDGDWKIINEKWVVENRPEHNLKEGEQLEPDLVDIDQPFRRPATAQ